MRHRAGRDRARNLPPLRIPTTQILAGPLLRVVLNGKPALAAFLAVAVVAVMPKARLDLVVERQLAGLPG